MAGVSAVTAVEEYAQLREARYAARTPGETREAIAAYDAFLERLRTPQRPYDRPAVPPVRLTAKCEGCGFPLPANRKQTHRISPKFRKFCRPSCLAMKLEREAVFLKFGL